MDTIEEHVDLGINENGIAAIAVKVTAERILPVDVDNNLWRRSSVTVTRTIEIDLMRCEETRLLYEKILKGEIWRCSYCLRQESVDWYVEGPERMCEIMYM